MRIGKRGMGMGAMGAGARLGALSGALSGMLCAALPAGAANTAYTAPAWVEGRHAFTLALAGETDICVSDFTHQEAAVIGGQLVISVLQQRRGGFLCTNDPSWPYRTEFAVPGLDSGNYPVKVRWRSACEFDPAPCPAAMILQDAGTLRVTDSAGLAYHIGPRSVPADRASKLLLRGRFGCSDRITGVSVDTTRPSIVLNFAVETSIIQCDTIVPGVEFPLPPLRAGVWQVYAAPSPYCPPGTPCPLYKMAPQLAGALEANPSGITALAPSRGPRSQSVRGGSAEFRPPGFRAPGFRGNWRGVPRDAAGRREALPRRPAAARVERGDEGTSEPNLQGGNP